VQRYAELLSPAIEAGARRAGWSIGEYAPGRSSALDRLREWVHLGGKDELFWTPCQRGSLLDGAQVITVHDCINVEHVYRHDWRVGAFKAIFDRVLERARVVVAISEATRNALLRCYSVDPKKLTVIRSPSDLPMAPAVPRQITAFPPFVLIVTNSLPHKNTLLACRAFAASRLPREGVSLCVVGALSIEARAVIDRANVRLVECAGVSDAELVALYRDCAFLFSPSLAEGHNLTIAEARCVGAPVLCSDIDVHREFFQDQAMFFNPTDVDSAVHAIETIWGEVGPCAERTPATFGRGIDVVAKDYLDLFRRAGECR
jgi:glycosyltransferase involved in cell wall biosynthesis